MPIIRFRDKPDMVAVSGMSTFDAGTPPALRGAWIRQRLDETAVTDFEAAIQSAVRAASIPTGARFALAVGSRGIDRLPEVVACLVNALHERGARPFVIPAMGSHGGATAAGQRSVLAQLGVTFESVGCPIEATMDTVSEARVDRLAYEADAVIPINRVKPHTGFDGVHGSGLIKMMAIGLGNRIGASELHAQGYEGFAERLRAAAKDRMSVLRVPFGVALVENGLGHLATLECVPAVDFELRDAALLQEARERMARLPSSHLDVLIVDQIGKDISGVGMDPNVIGRDHRGQRTAGPHIQRIVVRGLTAATGGHATGIGLADLVLERVVRELDQAKTWVNALTARTPEYARIPMSLQTDAEALSAALICCHRREPGCERVLWVKDTHHLGTLWASEALLPELISGGQCIAEGPVEALQFDEQGMLFSLG